MAARYRKIDPRMWNDEKFSKLPAGQKLIAVYLISAQSNRIGMFRFSFGMAAEHLNLEPETFRKGFGNVCDTLKWPFDEGSKVLLIPTWWKYNPPENPNVLKSCMDDLHEVPQTPLIKQFAENTRYLPATFLETFREGLGKQSPNQEQEQEQEQESKKGAKAPCSHKANGVKGNPQPAESGEGAERSASTPAVPADPKAQKPARKTRGNSVGEPRPEHAALRDYFLERWKARYRVNYPWKFSRDDAHAKWILDECGRDLARAKAIVDAYVSDPEPFFAKDHHPLGLLVSKFSRFVGEGAPGDGVIDTDRIDGTDEATADELLGVTAAQPSPNGSPR